MKITFEGVTRVLDLQHVNLKPATAIQDYLGGMAIFAWQERLSGIGDLSAADVEQAQADGPPGALQALKKMPMFTDPKWVNYIAAAHWLMLAQAGEDPPSLDDEYDFDVLGFAVAFLTAMSDEVRAKTAKKVPDKPDPTARPGRRAPSSRQTTPKTAKKPIPVTALQLSSPTGS